MAAGFRLCHAEGTVASGNKRRAAEVGAKVVVLGTLLAPATKEEGDDHTEDGEANEAANNTANNATGADAASLVS